MMWRLALLGVGLVACDDRLEPADTEDPVPCGVSIDETVPTAGSTDAYWRAAVEFHLTEPDPTAVVEADFEGTAWVSDDEHVVGFTPATPLVPGSSHRVTLDYCGGSPTIRFTTSDLGTPLDPTTELAGRAYRIALADGRFAAGDGLADVAATLVSRKVLAAVDRVDGDALYLRLSIPDANSEEQNHCSRTVELPAADFSAAPYFSLEAERVEFNADDTLFALHDVSLAGTVASDGGRVGGIAFQATLDGRDVADFLGLDSADTLCGLAATLAIPCTACPEDGATYCVKLAVDQLEATFDADLVVDPILVADTDPRCEAD